MARGDGKGKRGRRKGDPNNRGQAGKTPEQFMRQLVPLGPRIDHAEYIEAEPVDGNAEFGKRREYIDPVEFCQAVINNNQEILSLCGVMEPIGLEDKLAAAKIAAPYTNKKKPVETVSKHQFSWVDEITEAENRTRNLRMDIEENDRAPASAH